MLGTVTKPVGGIFDLVSGMMSSISEAACPSNLYRPRRRRPRRAGLSKYFPRPISVYNLDESVAQLQMYYLTLFTNVQRHSSLQKHHHYSSTSLSSSSSSTLLNPAVITSSSKTFEIGEEILTDINIDDHDDDDNNNHNSSSSKDDNNMTINLSQSTSHMLQTYVLQSCNSATKLPSPHLRYLLNSPESVLCILPVQMTGVIMLITDQAFWCIRDISLKNWIASKNPIHECINMTVQNGQSNLTRGQQPQQPAFYFTENATLMFMLHYHRLDDVYLKLHTSLNAITPLPIHPTNGHILSIDPSSPSAAAATISPPVYVVFTGDSGTNVSSLSSPVYSTPSNSNYNQVPRYQNHPVALSYGPICQ
ncbi:unnamed protein product [Trichobilharzia regenti]|nr:unnamed protein product [Trichobilharzia regenti]